jgi:hypothetical protein
VGEKFTVTAVEELIKFEVEKKCKNLLKNDKNCGDFAE